MTVDELVKAAKFDATSKEDKLAQLRRDLPQYLEWQRVAVLTQLSQGIADARLTASTAEEQKRNAQQHHETERVLQQASVLAAATVEVVAMLSFSLAQNDDEQLKQRAKASLCAAKAHLLLLLALVRGKVVGTLPPRTKELPLVLEIYQGVEEKVRTQSLDGTLNQNIVAAASAAGTAQQIIVGDFEQRLSALFVRARNALTQTLAVCRSIAVTGQNSVQTLIEMAATGGMMLTCMSEAADLYETTRYLKLSENTARRGSVDGAAELLAIDDRKSDVRLWDELRGTTKMLLPEFAPDGTPRKATLNRLIEYLTDPSNIVSGPMRTFVISAPEFTTPAKLLDKLIERFDVPPGIPDAARIKTRDRKSVV